MGHVETVESVAEWCEVTFGPASAERLVLRAEEELIELKKLCVDCPDRAPIADKIAEELADILICLARVVVSSGSLLLVDPKSFSGREGWSPLQVEHAIRCAITNFSFALGRLFGQAFAPGLSGAGLRTLVGLVAWEASNLAYSLGVDLKAKIDQKMQVNRKRTWRRDNTGCGYHVKPEDVA